MSTTTSQLPLASEITEEERSQLMQVMKKAQEFEVSEEKQLLRQPLEGQLFKYTNVMKGWQYRWFVLNPEAGRLEYYEKEEHKRLQRPRGCLMLSGASVIPSDEDSQTFSVNAVNGDSYRLKAFDAKERQHWVNRLRATAEYHCDPSSSMSLSSGSILPGYLQQQIHSNRQFDLTELFAGPGIFNKPRRHDGDQLSTLSQPPMLSTASSTTLLQNVIASDSINHIETSLKTCIDSLSVIRRLHKDLSGHIEMLPSSGDCVGRLDKELLLLKATSSATLNCLEQCLSVLQRQVMSASRVNGTVVEGLQLGNAISNCDAFKLDSSFSSTTCQSLETSQPVVSFSSNNSQLATARESDVTRVCRADEIEDSKFYTDTDLTGFDEQKNVVLHLLAQLKLGMDLTKVVLPTFILEKRSLLEMFADCMAHPEMFLRISDASTAEERMLAVFEWYLLSFHAARQGSIAKKPYNPIIGECFHCSWTVNDCDKQQVLSVPLVSPEQAGMKTGSGDGTQSKLYFCAEQVSHHPPISAFYFECPSKHMYMEGSIWTRSKFMGMSIGVAMIGKVRLRLLSPSGSAGVCEDYEFSLPSVFARSILTIPWVELGDKVTIQCDQTGYSAGIIFHTKPFYGGRLHRVTGDVRNPTGETLCRVAGEWNGSLEFTYSSGQLKTIDTTKLPVAKKHVRPIDLQTANESRRLWRHVTESLEQNDLDKATEHKRILEDSQRESERIRREAGLPFSSKYFHQVGDDWTFKAPLGPEQVEPSM